MQVVNEKRRLLVTLEKEFALGEEGIQPSVGCRDGQAHFFFFPVSAAASSSAFFSRADLASLPV